MVKQSTKRILIAVSLAALPAILPAHPLWNQAVESLRMSEDLLPGSMAARFDQYNGRGGSFGAGQGEGGDAGEGASPFAGLQRNPFAPEEQLHVTILGAGGLRVLDGIIVLPIEFEHRTGPDAVNRGTAWLDADTGDPVQLETTIAPLSRFVSELVMVQHYARNKDGQLVVERVEFSGEGRVLLFRRRLESVLFFSEYFRLP